jgi:hypothetical protein
MLLNLIGCLRLRHLDLDATSGCLAAFDAFIYHARYTTFRWGQIKCFGNPARNMHAGYTHSNTHAQTCVCVCGRVCRQGQSSLCIGNGHIEHGVSNENSQANQNQSWHKLFILRAVFNFIYS